MAGLVALCLFLLANQCQGQGNAEVEISLSRGGINYAAGVMVDILSRELPNKEIPDIPGNPSISKIMITEFAKPTAEVHFNEGAGVTLVLNNAYVKAEAKWKWEKKIWFVRIRDSGSVTASSKASISLSVRVASSGGRPTISAHSCSASLPDLSVRVGGTWTSFIYNWLLSLFKRKIRSSLEVKICDSVKSIINTKGARELNTLILQAKVNRHLTVDYSLPRDPYFGSTFLKSYHRGTFVGDSVNNLAGQTFSG